MNESIKPTEIIFSQFEYAFSVIDKCTDDYIFIYDLINDNYTISDSAVKRFPLPSSKFENVSEALKNVIHPDDYNMIVDNIKGLINGTETKHNFEYRWKNLENDYIWISCHGQLVLDHNNKPAYLAGRISEIGSLKRADNLTGLLTDIQLTKDYNSYISKFGNIQGYLMRIEVVNLKHLCRRYGKSVGNYVLHILAKILESAVTNKARPYKYESSSFLIFDYSRGTVEDAKLTFENIRRAISKACEDLDYKIFFTVSAGIVEINSNVATEIEDLYKKAEFSIYHIQKKENNIAVFDEEEYNTYIRKLQIQENLRKSINNNFEGFELYYHQSTEMARRKL